MCEVIERVKSLRGSEREVVADLIRELSVIYKERLFAEAGYPSLFVFCTEGLGYSEGAAWRRAESVRVKNVVMESSAPLFSNTKECESNTQPMAKRSFTVTLELTEEEMQLIEQAQMLLSTSQVKPTLLGAIKKLIQREQRFRES